MGSVLECLCPPFYALWRRFQGVTRVPSPSQQSQTFEDLILQIFKRLNRRDLLTAGRVCRRWRVRAFNPLLWQEYPAAYPKPSPNQSFTTSIDLLLLVALKNCISNFPKNKRLLERVRSISFEDHVTGVIQIALARDSSDSPKSPPIRYCRLSPDLKQAFRAVTDPNIMEKIAIQICN